MTTRLLLVRHAESTWNALGRWQGQANPPLSETGRRQAKAVAQDLAGMPAARLLASDLARAVETAGAIGRRLRLAPELDPGLRELDVGDWSGRTRSEIEARDADRLARFEAEEPEVAAGGAESRADIRRRVRATFAGYAARFPDTDLIVVTHLGVVRALLPGTELENTGVATWALDADWASRA
ncbi:MAG: histidine phosphatase family protein [Myxococcota bacterium]